ncbi:uncharacterized protein LAESUDRAFT_764714 [Laetiporus sulphureus 93-53]|uniref:Uncharacterized protein n=1 Tax=Laetiporus sulphureus 93-53 TaxID=1314785 RepID=A0A165B5M5_9APHY|nr:uncharacterized protein LAESUDRAFT_764714 [Laetiporus sulphureus 93-53]KZT00292.1 hypothetical protein LAESUDRAFT_764714 [Laetiporus sulphureus 93-53]
MLLAGVPEAFTRLFCSRYRGTLASLLDNARALREALGVMGADASEEVEVVVKEQEAEEGSKSQDIGVDEATLDDEAAQSLAETMDSQEREKTHGDDGREIEKGHDVAPEDKRGHDSGNEQVQEKGKGKEKDAEEAQSTADGEENTGDGEKEEPQKNRDEEEKETEREKSEGISKNPEEDVIPEDELAPPQAEQQPKAKAPQQQQENSKTQKEPTQPKNTKTVQCWRASYFEVRVPDAYGDGLVDTETMEDECAHADVDVDMDGAAAAVSILGMTALGLARVDFERGEHEREVRRAEVMLVRPRVVSENILGWTGQERDGVDGDVMMGVA